MSKFECKNCGFVVEQVTQPESCPICGEHDFMVRGDTQVNADTVKNKSAREASLAHAAPKNNYAQFREFPVVQRERVKKELEKKLNDIQEEMQIYVGEQEIKNKKKNDKAIDMESIVAVMVMMIGVIATCCGSCYACAAKEGFTSGFEGVLQTIFAGVFITFVASFAMATIVGTIASPKKKDQKSINAKKYSAEEEKKSSQEAARKSISEYSQSFDRAVKDVVQKFVSNKTTEEIGNRILGSFLDAIERSSRDAGRKDISVRCQYSVYANQVQYEGGIFSFSQNHCSNLVSPVEQAALGQAIALYLEIRVLEKYDKDPCGSVPQIAISIEDNAASRVMTVTYNAANVNYRGL